MSVVLFCFVSFVLSGCYVVMLCVKRNKKMLITKKRKHKLCKSGSPSGVLVGNSECRHRARFQTQLISKSGIGNFAPGV